MMMRKERRIGSPTMLTTNHDCDATSSFRTWDTNHDRVYRSFVLALDAYMSLASRSLLLRSKIESSIQSEPRANELTQRRKGDGRTNSLRFRVQRHDWSFMSILGHRQFPTPKAVYVHVTCLAHPKLLYSRFQKVGVLALCNLFVLFQEHWRKWPNPQP